MGIKNDNTSDLHDAINTCDILIAFMIENDTHAVYDIGYAMSKGKKVLIIIADYSKTSLALKMAPTILLCDYFDTSSDILNFVDNCCRQTAPENITPK